jgi:smad nuclear-interacting protein 1
MPQHSPSPGSSKRYSDREDIDRYRGRHDATNSYGRGTDRESRDGYRVSERERRRDHANYDDRDYRRRDRGDRGRRDDHDNGRRRRDDDHRSRQEDHHDRDKEDRPPRDHRDRDRNGEREGSARRSASPRRSRPRSPSHSRSASASAPPAENKAKPNFAPSGLLAAATNTVKNADGSSTLLKYNEPPEARKPLVGWRLYVFKGEEQLGVSNS